jgi:hypothetical protein
VFARYIAWLSFDDRRKETVMYGYTTQDEKE